MKKLFRITRTDIEEFPGAFLFELISPEGHELASAQSRSPIPPQHLRDLQAQYNTKLVLDELGL